MRIMVSTNERRLLLVTDRDTLLDVAVAVGMGSGFEFEGRRHHFETPTGRRRVLIFIPPFGTAQRRIPDALGPYKLDLGNGYLIHGTHMFNEESVGLPVSHGCVRMNNADLDRLYYMVETGTPVFIY
jgi:lipoprotein-anchoring transpeptidase ErfK/SrfK